jgi:hypothetical protein
MIFLEEMVVEVDIPINSIYSVHDLLYIDGLNLNLSLNEMNAFLYKYYYQ